MSFGLLVGRFGEFVRKAKPPRETAAEPEKPLPEIMAHIREICAHHAIPLVLLSRADGESVLREQEAIVAYCRSLLKKAGLKPGPSESSALAEYIASLQPTLVQLDPALKRVEHEGASSMHGLIGAAIQVMEADGRRDPAEVRFLDALSKEIARLGA